MALLVGGKFFLGVVFVDFSVIGSYHFKHA